MRPSQATPGGNGNQPDDINGLPFNEPYRPGVTFFGNGQKLARWYYLVEVTFKTPATIPNIIQVPLNNDIQGFLLSAFIWSIEAYSAATLTGTKLSASGQATIIPQANFSGSQINLFDNLQKNFWQDKPLRDLQTINDTANAAGKSYVDNIGGVVINWQQCNISIYNTSELTASTTYSIPLGIAFSQFANWKEDGVGTNTYNMVSRNS
jgi:hypothetical protein